MKWFYKLLAVGAVVSVILILLSAGVGAVAYYRYILPNLPNVEELRQVQLQVPLKVYAKEGGLIAEFGAKRRSPVTFAQIPSDMVNAITAAEDGDFFNHQGIDPRGLLRAGLKLMLTGERRQGGSTITMQVARNFYLTRQKTYLRKIYEILLAFRIEKELSKQEIFELYVNKIFLGQRAHGISAAAMVYYGKNLHELNLAQTAMIAGLPKAPSRFNPIANPERALIRRDYVLGRMLALDLIQQHQYDAAIAAPVTAQRYTPEIQVKAPYVAEMVRAEMIKRYGAAAYTSGYNVYTTIQAKEQEAANLALRKALDDYSDRHGYHGPEQRLADQPITDQAATDKLDDRLAKQQKIGDLLPGIVTGVEAQSATVYLGKDRTITLPWQGLKWAKPHYSANYQGDAPKTAADILQTGDLIRVREVGNAQDEGYWRLTQAPKVSGALISLKANDGAMLALVGGYDYYTAKFNRATQALRQPGSGLKAFVYSAALARGFTPASIINDAPVVFDDRGLEGAWRPKNYSGRFYGPTRMRVALTYSRNLVSVRLLRRMGIDHAMQHIAKFGFRPDQLSRNLSLALGNASVTPLQMARAYAVLANGGYLVEPHFIERITQGDNTLPYTQPLAACENCVNPAPRTISAQNRFLMYSMLQDVIKRGTATKAKKLGRKDIAGKTGTTNDQRDAWFNGFNQSIVTNVWVGFDDNSILGRGEVGGKAALPAWIDYMQVALADTADTPPEMPENIISMRIDPLTGLRASAGSENAIYEIFENKRLPGSTAAPSGDGGGAPIFGAPVNTGGGPAPDAGLF